MIKCILDRRCVKTWRTLLLAALAGLTASVYADPPPTPEYDEIFPSTQREIISGPSPLSQAECEAKPYALWITAQWVEKGVFSDSTKTGQACIRYFPSNHAANALRPLLFIQGDRVEPEGFSDGTYRKQIAFANLIAKQSAQPTIVIARPGSNSVQIPEQGDHRKIPLRRKLRARATPGRRNLARTKDPR